MVGKTNTPECGSSGSTEPVATGPTHNPWLLGHSPGGSSGGSPAAVAVGIVPAAHASDGGGSIRGPASCCGLVGLKPKRGRNSLPPDAGEVWQGFVAEHVVSRSVRDSAARGIGCVCALRFAEEGARVALLDIAQDIAGVPHPGAMRQQLDMATAALTNLGGEALALVADVTDTIALDAAVQTTLDRWDISTSPLPRLASIPGAGRGS